MASAELNVGDRAYTYVWAGGEAQAFLGFTIRRVNRVTYTVELDDGTVRRIPKADVIGKASY